MDCVGDSRKYFICNQYIHGLAARGVHYLHRPGPILQDMGFMALPVCHLLIVSSYHLEILDADLFVPLVSLLRVFRSSGKTKVILVRLYSLPSSFRFCW